MEDFVKSVVKNFSKEYRQQPLPTDLQAEVKARFHKEKKRYTWLRFRNRSLQSSLVELVALSYQSICFQVLVKQPATSLC